MSDYPARMYAVTHQKIEKGAKAPFLVLFDRLDCFLSIMVGNNQVKQIPKIS